MFSYITPHSKFFSNISEAPSLIQKQMGISAHIWIMSFSTHLWASQVTLCRNHKRLGFNPWVGKIPWRRAWQSAPVFLPGESHGQMSLAGYSSWGRKESDMTEVTYPHAHTHTYGRMGRWTGLLHWVHWPVRHFQGTWYIAGRKMLACKLLTFWLKERLNK